MLLFGFLFKKKNIAAAVLSLIEPSLRENMSLMEDMMNERLEELEKQMLQSLRQERRRQMALESILESQNRILKIIEPQEISPTLEALISLAENLALTRHAEQIEPESDILFNKLSNLMDCFDLTLVSETGVLFDPEKHEACAARCVWEHQDGLVLEIIRPGFLLRDKVLRYATVVVNRHVYDDADEDSMELYDEIGDYSC
jgi:molecular chaperone GrpE